MIEGALSMQNWLKGRITTCALLFVFFIALAGLYFLEIAGVKVRYKFHQQQLSAASLMLRVVKEISNHRVSNGIEINKRLDINQTGLIGEEFTCLTTTLGNLEAKRSTTNPAFAAMMVKFFHEAGLKKGDNIAIGASGSFPALIIAALAASQVMELNPIIIYSVGSSMYGANLPDFTLIQMMELLNQKGLIPYKISAVWMGGEQDQTVSMFFPDSKEILLFSQWTGQRGNNNTVSSRKGFDL